MTITTVHPPGGTRRYSIDYGPALPQGVALAGFEVSAIGGGIEILSSSRDGNKVIARVSGGNPGGKAKVRFIGITDETPPDRYPQTICLQIADICVTEVAPSP